MFYALQGRAGHAESRQRLLGIIVSLRGRELEVPGGLLVLCDAFAITIAHAEVGLS